MQRCIFNEKWFKVEERGERNVRKGFQYNVV